MRKVLIVEDDYEINECLFEAVEHLGYEADTAFDGETALAKLEGLAGEPCLLLVDLMLPRLSGFELIRVVRSDPRFFNCRVVAITAYGEVEQVPGADWVLRKPFGVDALEHAAAEVSGLHLM